MPGADLYLLKENRRFRDSHSKIGMAAPISENEAE